METKPEERQQLQEHPQSLLWVVEEECQLLLTSPMQVFDAFSFYDNS